MPRYIRKMARRKILHVFGRSQPRIFFRADWSIRYGRMGNVKKLYQFIFLTSHIVNTCLPIVIECLEPREEKQRSKWKSYEGKVGKHISLNHNRERSRPLFCVDFNFQEVWGGYRLQGGSLLLYSNVWRDFSSGTLWALSSGHNRQLEKGCCIQRKAFRAEINDRMKGSLKRYLLQSKLIFTGICGR